MDRIPVGLSIDKKIFERIEFERGPINRSAYVVYLLYQYFKNVDEQKVMI
jgi:hypothetical protein